MSVLIQEGNWFPDSIPASKARTQSPAPPYPFEFPSGAPLFPWLKRSLAVENSLSVLLLAVPHSFVSTQ